MGQDGKSDADGKDDECQNGEEDELSLGHGGRR
jgi:hypothetical protein